MDTDHQQDIHSDFREQSVSYRRQSDTYYLDNYNYPDYEYQLADYSICNCDDCQSVVYAESLCSCGRCYDQYTHDPQDVTYYHNYEDYQNGHLQNSYNNQTGYVSDSHHQVDVIDLTGSDDDDVIHLDESKTDSEARVEHQRTRDNNSHENKIPSSQKQESSETAAELLGNKVTQDCQNKKENEGETYSDGFASDGSGEFDIQQELERIKQSKKRRKERNKKSSKMEAENVSKKQKTEATQKCKKSGKSVQQRTDLDNSFLPRRCKKKRPAGTENDSSKQMDSPSIENTTACDNRLGLELRPSTASASLEGLTELEKLATFPVSDLYPKNAKNSSLALETVFAAGSKNHHTGGILNDILSKVRLRSKVKL